jgi:EAL domain-containing protein (putative c-di-GMP-specific phosphodiesterase class I)
MQRLPRGRFTMAFQPIVHANGFVWGYEALVRGPTGEGAATVLSQVTDENRYRFDQDCRVKAISLAAQLFPKGGSERLSINFMPNAVYEPSACIQATLEAACNSGFRSTGSCSSSPKTSASPTQSISRTSSRRIADWASP